VIPLRDVVLEEAYFHVCGDWQVAIAAKTLAASPEVLALPVRFVPVEAEMAAWVMEHRGVEQHRFERITQRDLVVYPITICHLDAEDADMIVDGAHRYAAAHYRFGRTRIRARIVPESIWRRYEVDAPPMMEEELAKGWSGIT
jgi:hypothetical protein